MREREAYGLGYQRVDGEENIEFHVATMEDTSRWEAIRELRSWERAQLGLRVGERLLDVGCGLGDVTLAYAADVAPGGEAVGVDASAAMLRVARKRAERSPVAGAVRFSLGDALDLDEPDASFDAVRSERTLQWVADPAAAVAEMARVLRPGGRFALIDTDWSTLTLDIGDDALTRLVRDALQIERARPSLVGRRLAELARAAGLDVVTGTEARHVWTRWDPDASPAPDGCFSMASLADDLVATGHLEPGGADAFVTTVADAARRGRFTMAITMYAVVATAPVAG